MWDENNSLKPDEISISSSKRVLIKCSRQLHTSREISINSIKLNQKGICLECGSFAQFIVDKYGNEGLSKYWDYEKNINLDPWKIRRSSGKKVYLKCFKNPEHKSYLISCNAFTYAYPNSGCPLCNVRGKYGVPAISDSLGALIPQSLEFWSSKNNYTPYYVTPKSHKKAWWICEEGFHDDYLRTISETLRYDFRCPVCQSYKRSSFLQTKVYSFLTQELGYTVNTEYNCSIIPPSLSNYRNSKLPFDNEVVELKLIIEVNGKQHYDPCSWHLLTAKRRNTTKEIEFELQQKRDKFKEEYALQNGYHYLVVPYYMENKDTYKQIIIEKINQINKKYRIRNDHSLKGND